MFGSYFEEFWVIRIILDANFIQDVAVSTSLESILLKHQNIEINLDFGKTI